MFDSKFIADIAVKTGRPPELIQSVASSIVSEMMTYMLAGKEVEISGFGTFGRRYLRPRQGFNPAKGIKIQLDGSYRPDFKFNASFGNEFADKLANEPAPNEQAEAEVPKVFDKVQIPASALPSVPPPPPTSAPVPPPPPPPVEEPEYHVAVDGNVSKMKRSQIPPNSLVYDGSNWVKAEAFLGQ